MTYIPILQQLPEKDETGNFRCKNCGMIITYEAYYCDACNAKRSENTKKFLKKYWWIIALLSIILFLLIIELTS